AAVEAGRRAALWQLGVAVPAAAAREGTQLSLALGLSDAPRLPKLGRWQQLIADYATSGITVSDHAMAVLRERLCLPGKDAVTLATSAQLPRLPSGCAVAIAGLVIARRRPGTANGTMFLLFEDEWGTVNLIVPPGVYERHRHLARAEPLLLARGRLERAEGVINVIVRELAPLESFLAPSAEGAEGPADASREASVHELRPAAGAGEAAGEAGESDATEVGASMRAHAP